MSERGPRSKLLRPALCLLLPASGPARAQTREQLEVRGHPEYTVWGRKSYYAPGP